MKKKKSITRSIRDEAYLVLNETNHDLTRSSYKRIVKRYIEYCRQEFKVKTLEECKAFVQIYLDNLVAKGYSASTIHTYCAAISKTLGTRMDQYEKPIRYVAEYKKGRQKNKTVYKTKTDLDADKWKEIVAFQKMVGIRRRELEMLCGNDIVEKYGHTFVYVRNGKGGKNSYVYITPENTPAVRSYFANKAPDERIFDSKLFKNDLNLHYLRAMHAQEMYKYFESKIKENPDYKKELTKLVIKIWQETNLNPKTKKPRPFPYHSIMGKYVLRGKNRQLAIKQNLPVAYDRLIIRAVSVLCLSHFREDVVIGYMNY